MICTTNLTLDIGQLELLYHVSTVKLEIYAYLDQTYLTSL